jgi:hypothetical protein
MKAFLFSGYSVRGRILLVHLPISDGCIFATIGIAILAKVRTGIVFSYVLTDDTATELSLTFVLVVFLF